MKSSRSSDLRMMKIFISLNHEQENVYKFNYMITHTFTLMVKFPDRSKIKKNEAKQIVKEYLLMGCSKEGFGEPEYSSFSLK